MLRVLEKIKFKKENLFLTLFIIIGIASLYIFNDKNILFFMNIILVIWTVVKSKFSFFSVKTVIVNYILFAVFSQYNYNTSYGILQINSSELYYLRINAYILIYNTIALSILINSSILQYEKDLLNRIPAISKLSTYTYSIIAIIATLIAMPTLPFLESYERFNALLPGDAWNHIAIIALIFLFPKLKDSKLVKFTYIFVIFWFLSHYERVDVIGLIIAIIILICIRKIKKIKLKTIIILRNEFSYYICNYDLCWRFKNRI